MEGQNVTNMLSFASILKSRDEFRKAGGKFGSDFNLYDTPGQKYFKLFFYFNNSDDSNSILETDRCGLLAPMWQVELDEKEWYMHDTAWTYLKLNCEDERAEKLEQFVTLLSNINSTSPWYFSELTGLDAALDRKFVLEESFNIENKRNKISIKCLPDAFDDRISTLLDLYRSIVWSWVQKKEIVPSNLRKFDMGILIFDTPTTPYHQQKSDWSGYFSSINEHISALQDFEENSYAVVGPNHTSSYKSSYKYIELHNCEIDYNSSKSVYSTFSNKEGTQLEYTIDIYFDDCYESRYNEFLLSELGDLIKIDLLNAVEWSVDENLSIIDTNREKALKELGIRSDFYKKSFLENMKEQGLGVVKGLASNLVNKIALGNLYTFSLSKIGSQIASASKGNVWSTVRAGVEYVNDFKQRKDNNIQMNLFGSPKKTILPTVKKIGNIAQAKTIKNNI